MRITKLLGKEKLHEMIRASIADFVANEQSEAVEDENYDLQKAAKYQKQIEILCKVVLKNVSKALLKVEEA